MFLRERITVLVSPKSLCPPAAPPPCNPEFLEGATGRVPGLGPPGRGGRGGRGAFKLISTFPIYFINKCVTNSTITVKNAASNTIKHF